MTILTILASAIAVYIIILPIANSVDDYMKHHNI